MSSSRASSCSRQRRSGAGDIGLENIRQQISQKLLGQSEPQLTQEDPCLCLDEFVRSNFQRLECRRFVPSSPEQSHLCGCKRDKDSHGVVDEDGEAEPPQQWSSDACRQRLPTNAHGEIKFVDFGKTRTSHRPKFVRLQATGCSMQSLWQLLTDPDKWALPLPEFVLSVSGGAADRCRFSKKFADKLQRAILQVTGNISSVWVITHGLGVGVSAEFGRLLRQSSFSKSGEGNVALIGINTWGIINNREMLEDDDSFSKGLKLGGEKLRRYTYTMGELSAGCKRLDKDHTNFILVDDGSCGSGGRDVALRTELQDFVMSQVRDLRRIRFGQASTVPPVVQLCVEGGRFTLIAAAEAARRETPVITVRGSGRCADILAWACDTRERQPDASELSDLQQLVAEKVAEFEDIDDEEEWQRLQESLLSLLSDSSAGHLTAFDPEAEDADLSRVVLSGVFRHRDFRDDRTQQARVAMALGRADVAETEIFANTSEFELQRLGMRSLFVEALLEQRVDFVRLFLDYGVSVTSVLSEDILRQLYLRFVTRHSQQSEILLGYIANPKTSIESCATCFCGDFVQDFEQQILHLVGDSLKMLTCDVLHNIYCPKRQPARTESSSRQLEYPPRAADGQRVFTPQDLFIWAILCHNVDLAMMFWKEGKDHLSTALIGRLLLRRMAEHAEARDEVNMMAAFRASASKFEELAVGVLSSCYSRSRDFTRALLIRELPMWNSSTALAIAETSECREFMHHSSVQEVLQMIWMGGMVTTTPTWKILVCMALPFLVPSVVFQTHRRRAFESLHEWRSRQSPGQVAKSPKLREALRQAEEVDPLAPNTREYLESLMLAEASSGTRSGKQLRREALYRQRRGFLSLSFLTCLQLFFTAPIVKFSLNFFSTLFFLLVLAYIVLVQLRLRCIAGGASLHWTEWYAGAWLLQYVVEEGRQFAHLRSLRSKLATLSRWDRFDGLLCLLTVVCVSLRACLSPATCDWARSLYAFTFALFTLRFMQFYCAHSSLGPKVLMVIQMFYGDIAFFLCILGLFIVAFGVASLSLLDSKLELTPSLLKDVVYWPYWQMYGDLGLDRLETGSGSSAVRQFFVILMLAVYMLGTNVLLLNLLIAMFNHTFEWMEPNSHKYWSHIRYGLIHEYYYRPSLPPPLSIFIHIWRLGKFLVRKLMRRCCAAKKKNSDDFVLRLELSHHQRLRSFEAQAADACRLAAGNAG